MSDRWEIPDSCTEDQFKKIIAAVSINSVLSQNQKAFYIEKLQNTYAQLVIKNAIKDSLKDPSKTSSLYHYLDIDDDIILRQKRHRE